VFRAKDRGDRTVAAEPDGGRCSWSCSPLTKPEEDLQDRARCHECPGGLTLCIAHLVSLQSIAQGEAPISEKQLLEAIRRELDKDGKGL